MQSEKSNIQHSYKLFINRENSRENKDYGQLKPSGVKIISSEVSKISFDNLMQNVKKINPNKKNTNFRISNINFDTITTKATRSINSDMQSLDESNNRHKRSFLMSAVGKPRGNNTYNSSSYSNTFKRSSAFGDSDLSPVKSKFDSRVYRESLEKKNFNQIEDEISKVIGSSFVNFKKNKPRQVSAKTYAMDVMSIRNFNPVDGATNTSCYDSIALDLDTRPISRNNQLFNSTQTSFFSKSEMDINFRHRSSTAKIVKIFDKSKEKSKGIEVEKPIINVKNFSKDKIPMEIKMKNFNKLRKKKKVNLINKRV